MAISDTSSYLLTTRQAGDPVNARYLDLGTGLTPADGGSGGTFTISPTKMLGSIEDLETVGFLVREAGDVAETRTLQNDGSISIAPADGSGNPVFAVVPNTTVQKTNFFYNGVQVGTARPAVNFIAGAGIGMLVQDNPGTQRMDVTINSGGSGGGGDYVTNPFNGNFTTTELTVTGNTKLDSAALTGALSVNGQIHAGQNLQMNNGFSLLTNSIQSITPAANVGIIPTATVLSIGENVNNITLGGAQTSGVITAGSATSTTTYPGNVVVQGTLTANLTQDKAYAQIRGFAAELAIPTAGVYPVDANAGGFGNKFTINPATGAATYSGASTKFLANISTVSYLSAGTTDWLTRQFLYINGEDVPGTVSSALISLRLNNTGTNDDIYSEINFSGVLTVNTGDVVQLYNQFQHPGAGTGVVQLPSIQVILTEL